MNSLKFICTLVFCAFLGACNTVTDRANVQVGFYEVRGRTFDELDKNIRLHGPQVKGVGNAVASAKISMIPEIKFARMGGKCRLIKTKVTVRANVTLPKLRDRYAVSSKMRRAFTNIENYAKMHEAVHVAIAEKYAEQAEKEIAAIGQRDTCDQLRKDVHRAFDRIMVKHNEAQLAFDRDEKRRFARLERTKRRS